MLMTEDQAEETWCPHTRVGEQASGAAENRPGGSFNCIASACAMWRWVAYKPAMGQIMDAGTKEWCQSQVDTNTGIELRGYCGLAGRP